VPGTRATRVRMAMRVAGTHLPEGRERQHIQMVVTGRVERDGLSGDKQQWRPARQAIGERFPELGEDMAQVGQGRGGRQVGPEQLGQERPRMATPRLDSQVHEKRAHLDRLERGHGLTIERDLEAAEERQRESCGRIHGPRTTIA
jgi:hypothetical protein